MLDSPLWFNSNSFQTFAAWIVSNFEKTIWARYFQNRRNHPRSSSPYGILDFKFTLNYKKSLREFWKGLDKNKKKKVEFVMLVPILIPTPHSWWQQQMKHLKI